MATREMAAALPTVTGGGQAIGGLMGFPPMPPAPGQGQPRRRVRPANRPQEFGRGVSNAREPAAATSADVAGGSAAGEAAGASVAEELLPLAALAV